MKIYTKKGDRGQTSLFGSKPVSKDNPLVEAYGTVDELNSVLGILIHLLKDNADQNLKLLLKIQHDLLQIGSFLAGGGVNLSGLPKSVKLMEKLIDQMDGELPKLQNFILPGGTDSAAYAHFARTVARRAERRVVKLQSQKIPLDKNILVYLNRLSDFLFTLARFLNFKAEQKDVLWQKI